MSPPNLGQSPKKASGEPGFYHGRLLLVQENLEVPKVSWASTRPPRHKVRALTLSSWTDQLKLKVHDRHRSSVAKDLKSPKIHCFVVIYMLRFQPSTVIYWALPNWTMMLLLLLLIGRSHIDRTGLLSRPLIYSQGPCLLSWLPHTALALFTRLLLYS